MVLRRLRNPDIRLLFGGASVDIDAREGFIVIRCRPEVPYQAHVLQRTMTYVEAMFKRFAETVNGKLGFLYKQIVWDVGETADAFDAQPASGLLPLGAFRSAPFARWEEASQLLDKLFRYGHAIVVGDGTSGKTILLDFFCGASAFPHVAECLLRRDMGPTREPGTGSHRAGGKDPSGRRNRHRLHVQDCCLKVPASLSSTDANG